MQTIDSSVKSGKELAEALRGNYGVERMPNGIHVLYQGRFVHFSGFFNGSQSVIEIPKIAVKIPVMFTGEDFSCMAVAEPNAGFIAVPDAAKEKKFVVWADCVLNT